MVVCLGFSDSTGESILNSLEAVYLSERQRERKQEEVGTETERQNRTDRQTKIEI